MKYRKNVTLLYLRPNTKMVRVCCRDVSLSAVVCFVKTQLPPTAFEILIAVVLKSSIYWDMLAICFQAGFLIGLFFDPKNGGDMFL
jgi:hypothetical protein